MGTILGCYSYIGQAGTSSRERDTNILQSGRRASSIERIGTNEVDTATRMMVSRTASTKLEKEIDALTVFQL